MKYNYILSLKALYSNKKAAHHGRRSVKLWNYGKGYLCIRIK